MNTTHPDPRVLAEYAAGSLPESDAATIESHLESCETCLELLDREQRNQELVGKLRGQSPAADSLDTPLEDWLQRVLEYTPSGASEHESAVLKLLSSPEQPDELGRIGRYRILATLGSGGMGCVFKALHPVMEREVALKVMSPRLMASPAAVARFQREVKAASKLHHPNIVVAYDADSVGELHFLVMEYVAGTDLAALLRQRGLLPIHQAAEFIRQAAVGLEHAHQQRMVHRDVKPSNLLLTQQGQIKVADFGLARIVSDGAASQLSGSQSVLGTPDYIAPEQAMNPHTADGRADIYSLGCTLYHLLSGHVPFPAESTTAKLLAHQTSKPAPLISLRPDLPSELSSIVEKMMAKSPAERFATPAAVAAALGPFASFGNQATLSESGASHIKPVSTTLLGSLVRRLISRPRVLVAALLFISILIAGGVLISIRTPRGTLVLEFPDGIPSDVEVRMDGKAVRLIPTDANQAEIAFAVGEHELFVKHGELEFRAPNKVTIQRQRAAPIYVSFEGHANTTAKLEQGTAAPNDRTNREPPAIILDTGLLERGASERFQNLTEVIRRIGTQRLENPNDPETEQIRLELRKLALEHAGTTLAPEVASLMARVPWPIDGLDRDKLPPEALELAGGGRAEDASKEIVGVLGNGQLKHWHVLQSAVFSPTQDVLATLGRDHSIRIWDPNNGRLKRELLEEEIIYSPMVFSPDGRLLATAAPSSPVKLWNVETGSVERRLDATSEMPWAMAFSPNGRRLAGAGNKSLNVWNVSSGKLEHAFPDHDAGVPSVVFVDENTLLVGSQDKRLKFRDLNTWGVTQELTGHPTAVTAVDKSLDGRFLVSGSEDGTLILWDAQTREKIGTFDGKCPDVISAKFSPDSKQIVSLGRKDSLVVLWDVESLKQARSLHGHLHKVTSVSFSRGGELLATSSYDLTAGLWNTTTGERLFPTPGPKSTLQSVAISPDGHLVVAAGREKVMFVWDVSSQRLTSTFPHGDAWVNSVAFTPDGKSLAWISEDLQLSVRDAPAGELTSKLQGQVGNLRMGASRPSLAISADGDWLAAPSAANAVGIWRLATKNQIHTLNGHTAPVVSVAFSPNSKILASGSEDKTVKLWDVAKAKEVKTLAAHGDSVVSVAFSPDGKLLATASHDRLVKVWRLSSDDAPLILEGHQGVVNSIAFSPRGPILASSGQDGTVRLWDPLTGRLVRTIVLGPVNGSVAKVVFSPEGRHLITANANGTVYVVRLESFVASTE